MVLIFRALKPINSGFVHRAASTLQVSSSLPTTVPKFVRIVEVGPRDGLQNEKSIVTASTKLALIDKLYKAGLRSIEAGAFVSPKWVPQMADAEEIFTTLRQKQAANEYPGATFSALTPNLTGMRHSLRPMIKIEIACSLSLSRPLCLLVGGNIRPGQGHRAGRERSRRVWRRLRELLQEEHQLLRGGVTGALPGGVRQGAAARH